jgi:hypothetical protein
MRSLIGRSIFPAGGDIARLGPVYFDCGIRTDNSARFAADALFGMRDLGRVISSLVDDTAHPENLPGADGNT